MAEVGMDPDQDLEIPPSCTALAGPVFVVDLPTCLGRPIMVETMRVEGVVIESKRPE